MGAWLGVLCGAAAVYGLGAAGLSCLGQQHPCPAHGIMLLHSEFTGLTWNWGFWEA